MITDDQIREALGVPHANNGHWFPKPVEAALPEVKRLLSKQWADGFIAGRLGDSCAASCIMAAAGEV